jgi:UDP-N-acetylmuramate dehydrogenase
MELNTDFSLKPLNTFGVEALAAGYVRFDEENEIIAYLNGRVCGSQRCLILGRGSNLLFVDDVDGWVLHPQLRGIEVIASDRHHIRLRAMAGENWDDLVAHTVAQGWSGLENLSLIPGSVGASVVQNIGAYGVEVKEVIDRVEAVAVESGEKVSFSSGECGFGYRRSHFKTDWAGHFIITAVVFRLRRQPVFVLDYPGVREALAVEGKPDLTTIRRAIVAIRRAKLPDPAEIGNAGSFFKNPVVDAGTLTAMLERWVDLPHFAQGDGRFKLAAGWLVERCGWKGRRLGRVGVHHQQALVLVNLGGATGRDVLDLSEQIRADVQARFGIGLEREVQVVGKSG